MNTVLDCRGLACPQPVIRAKELLDSLSQGSVEVLVDNEAAQSNLERFGKSMGCAVAVRSSGETRHITISKGTDEGAAKTPAPEEEYRCDLPGNALIYVIPAETMGRGDDALGNILMRAYIKTIKSLSPLPGKIFFYNTGVKITASESDLIAPLRELADLGVEIYSCGTCLDFLHLKDSLLVGQVTNMFEIMDAMAQANKVASPY
ncbi:sulfurtransferase-like selenium metabolism protein YedF [Thiovibrio frasassiensis]|uniref:Sulfurtransferase-like selenium metabolism protein YedF n=1 Tax=Thiovibrio frasassiensis TaxID=2984131 RepID=A0A9X4MDH1_9BACT|nr:sulfurtransferase-like selenium metabolism protein YedF [Thiovibrio frasassiensis]MDG4475559.1 sulfurtransferase-like selenium metabolism protein YedF [Thiovibrio frasassiensis]